MTEIENSARTHLRRIAAGSGEPGGAATVERALARDRQARRSRAAVLGTVVVTAGIAIGVPTAMAVFGSSAPSPTSDAAGSTFSSTPPAASERPVVDPDPSEAPVPGGGPTDPGVSVETGPDAPEQGVSYPYDLYTHCGIDVADFGGRTWRAVTPAPEPEPRPGPDGVVTYDGYTTGTMTLVEEDLLRFAVTDPETSGAGQTFDFVPMPETAQPPPPCA